MNAITGTATLVRLALRRERVRLPIWVAAPALLVALQAANIASTYPAEEDRIAATRLLAANPGLRLLRGPAANSSLGALTFSDAFWIIAVLAALMSVWVVVRHTRQDEESGRGEMIASAAVGPYASLAAAVGVAVTADLVLAGLTALGLVVSGLPVAGSAATGLAIGASGIAFAGIAAVAVQLASSARTATALSLAALGAAYLLRGIGDALGRVEDDGLTVTSAWPSWLSPLGWAQQVQAFEANKWWLLALPAALATATVAIGVALAGRRDHGLGIFTDPGGPAAAPRSLLSPWGLAWRLQRGVLLGWAVAMVIVGAVVGSLGQQIEDLARNARLVELLTALGGAGVDLSDTFYAALLTLIGAIVAGFPLQAMLRANGEESAGRLEHVLATAVGRTRWIAGHITCAVVGTLVLLLVLGGVAGLGDGLVTGEPAARLITLSAAALVQAPAILVLTGAAVAAIAFLPRSAGAVVWAGLTVAILLGPIGGVVDLPGAVRDLSPFTHVPPAPAADIPAAPLLALLALAALLTTAGLIRFAHRDLALPA
ncbi:exporter of polyketide antibiotics [Geodermatophilus aquaeductus]|uniref:ABC-2 type transport system permease protein n=1 Tax=Geodermatophilus aquaeductus TaxID=1564161 RepID=A0A521F9S9_9ACTN|nr:anibiotic ABC transporter [Geodermatophilus aquaeductus]SMO92965.1 ABC-2 type transport system permease protein [Geodermatophilus aquaeductus]